MRLKFALKCMGLLFLLYSFLRTVFLFLNLHSFHKYSVDLILLSFLKGIRFDASAIFILNIPFLLFLFGVPKRIFKTQKFQRILHVVFIVFNFPFMMASLIDSEYYKFTGNRMSVEIFFFQKEATNQLGQFLVNYWHIACLSALILFILFKLFPRVDLQKIELPQYMGRWQYRRVLTGILVVGILFLGIRGGWQPKPIQPAHAYTGGATELGVLTLNSTFTLIKSKVTGRLKTAKYFDSEKTVLGELQQNSLNYTSHAQKQNVVVIILESFATEFWGAANTYKGYTPFLDSLAKDGLFFKNNYANGRRSIDALPAILFGFPPFMSLPIVKSNYYSGKWVGIADAVKKSGYHVSFFHGARKGTMYFDAISALAGFDDYFPFERYTGVPEYDGHWGIYDEPFLQYMVTELNKHPQPFLSTVFTLSTHQPYQVPPQHEGRFPKGTLKIHESIGYADYAVQKFFEEAAKQPWYKNTLFVITGDHTQMSASENYNTMLGRYRVPLLFYHPSHKLKAQDPDRITQHTDIMPSILDYLGVHSEPYLLFGRSVFDEKQVGESMFFSGDSYWLVRAPYYLRFLETSNKSYLFDLNDTLQANPITDKEQIQSALEVRMKSYIQYYRNGLIENNLYDWHPSLSPQEMKNTEQ